MIKTEKASKVTHHVKNRSATMKCERLGPTRFRVTPAEKGKQVRIVEFFLAGFEGETEARIDCYEEDTLKSCKANICQRMCSHVNAAVSLLLEQNEEN